MIVNMQIKGHMLNQGKKMYGETAKHWDHPNMLY